MNESPSQLSEGKRILLIAYACEPDKGSESGIGWHWAKELSELHNILVVTRENNKEAINKLPYENKNLNFIYYDLPKWLSFWKHGQRGIYLYYFLWQIGVYIMLSKLAVERTFDFSMSLTFGNMWLPSFIGFLPIPFIWGPIGGGEHIPYSFYKTYPFREFIIELLRNIWIKLQFLNFFFIINCICSKLIIVRTKDTYDVIPNIFKKKTRILLETAMEVTIDDEKWKNINSNSPINIIYTGRLIPLKNVDIALHAFAIIEKKIPEVYFTIIGDGPQRKRLIKLSEQLHISNKVHFDGQKPREHVLNALSKSDIYVFPSIKECGPWSLMEAMASCLPVICFDTGGMSDIVTVDTGIKITPKSKETSIYEFANALDCLLSDVEKRKLFAINSQDRIKQQFSWKHKISEFNDLLGFYK